MFSDQIIIFINIACSIFFVILFIVLAAATRLKDSASWVASILVASSLPILLLYLSLFSTTSKIFLFLIIPSTTLNLVLIPSLWYFVRSQFTRSFHVSPTVILHLLPAIISCIVGIIYYSRLSPEEVTMDIKQMMNGVDNMPTILNNILMFIQLGYFPTMFWYIRRQSRYLLNNFSDGDYLTIRWIPNFVSVGFALLILLISGYIISPKDGLWINPIIILLAMVYLIYSVIRNATSIVYINRLPDTPAETQSVASLPPTMTDEQMKEICDCVTGYLQKTKIFKNNDLALSDIARETGIHHKKISTAINGYLHKNFLELVNTMRIAEAKQLLQSLTARYTVESVYPACGFRSRSSFFTTFKKLEGVSPMQWLKSRD